MNGAIWILLYFLANLTLTIHNKWILSRLYFSFPWFLTAIHIGVSGVGALMALQLVYQTQPQMITSKSNCLKLLIFSILYAVNIAVSNVSLRHVSLAFHQIVRSSTPAFTVVLEAIFLGKQPSAWIYISLVPVMLGICLATMEEFGKIGFSLEGFWLTIFGVVLSAAKGIITNGLLVGPLKLHPLDLLWKMSLCSVFQCVTYGTIFGELGRLFSYEPPNTRLEAFISIMINGFLAFGLNWVSFTANQKTSALSMTVAGNVKQVLSILLAVWIFATPVSFLNTLGILVTLVGGAWYSALVYQEKNSIRHRTKKLTCDYTMKNNEIMVYAPVQQSL